MRTIRTAGLGVLLLLASVPGPLARAAEPSVDVVREVVSLLERSCVRCHHPGNPRGKLSLASAAGLLAGGHVVMGKPDESPLLDLVSPGADGTKPRMPKEGRPLTPGEVAVLRRWIAAGARWPEGVVVQERAKADASWWSLQPLARVTPPATEGQPAAWSAHPIDRFVYARLRAQGLTPSPPADPRTLVRRLCYDLTGLPPTPEQLQTYARDPSPAAYAQLVEELLASPAYGEHWGRHWLDVVRFGESTGFERNVILHNAWPFRDYVIASFNEDKPFDQLVREHLAGDVLGADNPAVEVGTAFLVCGPYDNVGNQDAVQAAIIRANTIDDMIRATGEAFLGVTIGCARCHNHKFDPITQQDYYRLYATFAGTAHGARPVAPAAARRDHAATLAALQARREALLAEQQRLQAGKPAGHEQRLTQIAGELAEVDRRRTAVPPLPEWWVGTFRPAPGPFHVFTGGDPQKPGEPVAFASPSFLAAALKGYTLPATATEAERRLALARWIVAPDNPLTPRVLANRVWQYHFGTGLVDTPSDLGFMGGRPSHPELLDWLAQQLLASGWRLKPLHRLLVTSETYRQASHYRADAAAVDGDGRLLWRFPPRRLSGEEVRDTLLAVAGKLDRRMGGPGYQLYRYVQDNVATYIPLDSPGPETYRRGVYHQNARAARVDVLTDFDCPDPAFANPRRASTTTPLQALTLFNHRFTLDMAEALALRAQREAGSTRGGALARVFLLAYGRAPTADETAAATRLVEAHGLRALCRAVVNANEILYID